MNREHWKQMLPFVQAFAEGKDVRLSGISYEHYGFNTHLSAYTIVEPKKLGPLEAVDFIKDGPWWVRKDASDTGAAMITVVVDYYARYSVEGKTGKLPYEDLFKYNWQRSRDGVNWLPCSKEASV